MDHHLALESEERSIEASEKAVGSERSVLSPVLYSWGDVVTLTTATYRYRAEESFQAVNCNRLEADA
jgi:hypothetical protein